MEGCRLMKTEWKYENGTTYETRIVNDDDYFNAIDNQVRSKFKQYEIDVCLPMAKSWMEKSKVDLTTLKDYPIEGYYYESEELKLYFKIIRNLNHNKDIFNRIDINCDEFLFFKNHCENDIFGAEDPLNRNPDAIIKRRYDIMTLTMEDKEAFDERATFPWSMSTVMNALNRHYRGRVNLVELAYLTGDPKCLCCGAETNGLYRMFACISGSFCLSLPIVTYQWNVNTTVESLGIRLVDSYNKLTKYDDKYMLVAPSLDNIESLNCKAKLPRVSLLGYLTESELYYFWILDSLGNLSDKYSRDIITTESYLNYENEKLDNPGTGFSGNIFNAKPA